MKSFISYNSAIKSWLKSVSVNSWSLAVGSCAIKVGYNIKGAKDIIVDIPDYTFYNKCQM